MGDLFRRTDAEFSPCRTWRYQLLRQWDPGRPALNWLMLNPSTADEDVNDPTVERCERYARRWGYGAIVVTNLFAFRATDPSAMKAAADPVGPENDAAILEAAVRCRGRVLCAWGNHGAHLDRSSDVVARLTAGVPGASLLCLDVNRSGEPVHPLYQRADLVPVPYRRPAPGADATPSPAGAP